MNFFSNFVGEEPKVEDLLRHMDQVLEMGGEDCLAIGSDFDGCSGRFPEGIKGVQSVPDLRRALLAHGFGESLVEKIFHENAYRFCFGKCKIEEQNVSAPDSESTSEPGAFRGGYKLIYITVHWYCSARCFV